MRVPRARPLVLACACFAVAAFWRSMAAMTMRVTAIGEMALTTTPVGTRPPSCQVREATARLAQP